MIRALALVVRLVIVVIALAPAAAQASPDDPAALFGAGAKALREGRPGEAIADLEALGDRGVIDPVISYDRGLAYAARVRAGTFEPGDLGRAAHGFEEARELSRDPALVADATRALTAVRAEIARRRARAGDPIELDSGVSIGHSILRLLPEDVWAVLAVVFAVAAGAGVLVRARAKAPRARVFGTTTWAVAGALMALSASLTALARDARKHERDAVVVLPSVHLLDAHHVAIESVAPVPEGARVQLLDDGAEFTHIAAGGAEGWVPRSAVLPLARPGPS